MQGRYCRLHPCLSRCKKQWWGQKKDHQITVRLRLGLFRCKHNVRWQHLAQTKARLNCFRKALFCTEECSRVSSGTSSDICNLWAPIRSDGRVSAWDVLPSLIFTCLHLVMFWPTGRMIDCFSRWLISFQHSRKEIQLMSCSSNRWNCFSLQLGSIRCKHNVSWW